MIDPRDEMGEPPETDADAWMFIGPLLAAGTIAVICGVWGLVRYLRTLL